jgi:hypothetical protein
MRHMAIGGLVITARVTFSLCAFVGHSFYQGKPLSALLLSFAATWLAISVVFGSTAYGHALGFVVHLELWPQSQLALVRTAGLFSESVQLVGWQAFRTRRSVVHALSRDPNLRLRLKSGRLLAFEHLNGTALLG